MFQRLCFHSTILIVIVIVFYSSMLSLSIQLFLLCYFLLCCFWTNHSPQDPIIRSLAAQRTKGYIVWAFGATPSDAALVGSYLRAQYNPYFLSFNSWNSYNPHPNSLLNKAVFLPDFCQVLQPSSSSSPMLPPPPSSSPTSSPLLPPPTFFQIANTTVTIFPIVQSIGHFHDQFNGMTIGLLLSSMLMDFNIENFMEKALGQASNVLSAYFG